MKTLVTSLFLITLTSCGHVYQHRDYSQAMNHDDSSVYRPYQDFPVVMGDSGEVFESRRTRRARTPANEKAPDAFLMQELQQLEGNLSISEYSQYEEFEGKLGSVSEKIYFLKLDRQDRKYYLISKGFMQDDSSQYYHPSTEVNLSTPVETAERTPASESEVWPHREYWKQSTP